MTKFDGAVTRGLLFGSCLFLNTSCSRANTDEREYKIPFQDIISKFCDQDGDRLLSAEDIQVIFTDKIQSGLATSEQVLCISKNIIKDFDTDDNGKINLKQYLDLSAQSALQVLFFKSFKSFWESQIKYVAVTLVIIGSINLVVL